MQKKLNNRSIKLKFFFDFGVKYDLDMLLTSLVRFSLKPPIYSSYKTVTLTASCVENPYMTEQSS